MNEDSRNNIPSELEIQNNELTEEQLEAATGGVSRGMSAIPINRRCAADPRHVYFAARPNDVCPFCGAKEFILFEGD